MRQKIEEIYIRNKISLNTSKNYGLHDGYLPSCKVYTTVRQPSCNPVSWKIPRRFHNRRGISILHDGSHRRRIKKPMIFLQNRRVITTLHDGFDPKPSCNVCHYRTVLQNRRVIGLELKKILAFFWRWHTLHDCFGAKPLCNVCHHQKKVNFF